MATFQVPQFIDQKPKIIGPLTLPQFFYIAAAGGLVFTTFYIFNFFLWFIVSAVLIAIAVALAFGKINGQSFPSIILSAVKYSVQPQMFTWKREPKKTPAADSLQKIQKMREQMNIGEKIKSIALNVTTGKVFSPEKLRKTQKEETDYKVAYFATGERRLVRKVDYSE